MFEFIGKKPTNAKALALCRLFEAIHILCGDNPTHRVLPDDEDDAQESQIGGGRGSRDLFDPHAGAVSQQATPINSISN